MEFSFETVSEVFTILDSSSREFPEFIFLFYKKEFSFIVMNECLY
jgi:hypothetical protein